MVDQTSENLAANIKRLREARNMTQERLAHASGVPRPTIANLESGSANPTLAVLVRVAQALGGSIEQLIGAPRSDVRLYKAKELPVRKRAGVVVRNLLPEAASPLELDRVELSAGARLGKAPRTAGTRQYFICESGEVEIEAGENVLRASPGDVVAFSADQKHAYANRGRKPAVAYSVVMLSLMGA